MTKEADITGRLLDAALSHVVFDGWSEATFAAAAADAGVDLSEARSACPKGVLDLAVAYHRRGDEVITQTLDLGDMRYSEKVTELVWRRVTASDKEIVRRGAALFALPQHAALGGRLMWDTADLIWTVLGDTSRDYNWYSKRAILTGVISSTIVYWLGDTSSGDLETRGFLDRRIANVMRFEKFKADLRQSDLWKPLIDIPESLLKSVRAPTGEPRDDLPGYKSKREKT